MTNKKKSPNKMEESTKNDGEIIEICKKSPMTDKYVMNDWGNIWIIRKFPILETVKILWQDKAVNKKEFPEECAREREIMGQECIKWIEEVW